MNGYHVAVVGATGAVGTRMLAMVAQSPLPIASVKALASKRSAGKTVQYGDQELTVEETTDDSFAGIDIALFSAGGSVSKRFAPSAVKAGAIVVDNTSAFRMDPEIPLVVPEVNPEALRQHHGIIANPNCSTIQMVTALEPIRKAFGLERVMVSTYQAVSGAGQRALNEMFAEAQAYLDDDVTKVTPEILPAGGDKKHYQMAFNLLPQIDVFEDDGYSHEEWKMIHETKKIMMGDMDDPELKVTATCVRVPVPVAHGEEVYFEVAKDGVDADAIRAALAQAPGVVVEDDPAHQVYPQPAKAEGKREVFVGRIRPDAENPRFFHMWNVSDNLLKGAAWNSMQIAETMHAMGLIQPR
ncbi:MAG: aspartate-semialdehyde dehydrogenase [Lactobacillus sp.]|nr:aspartate-semialdehyde dehydrogenase [Lactobacillus sp.]MCI2033931.1 aspartate-semialdehyde dehydrogenase [Lactobacillus sp.]